MVSEEFAPLGDCPEGARKRYARAAEHAKTRLLPAIKLKCLDCTCWRFSEARRCEIRTCPLWAANQRIFGRRSR